MIPSVNNLLAVVVLLAAYWAIDRLLRQEGWVRAARWVGLGTPWTRWTGVLVVALPLAVVWRWSDLPHGEAARLLALVLVGILTWKAVTKDIDPAGGEAHGWERLLLLIMAVATFWSPVPFVVAAGLLTTPFGLWQHHDTLPMRVVQALVAYLGLSGLLRPWVPALDVTGALFFFVLLIQISHYFITAVAKALLGPRWYSWVLDNQLHHLAASAYSWGWARFLPWSVWRRVVQGTRRIEKPMQLFAFGLELLAPLALLHPEVAIGFCLVWSAFHLGVFALSGLLFWDWAVTNVAVAGALWLMPYDVLAPFFGVVPAVLGLVLMGLFPLRHKLWKPMPLGWWDTPFTQRVHWRVRGVSGTEYGLYNNFMCPHERLYGKVHGCFLAPVPVMTYHLGEVWKHDLRDALRAAQGCSERLDEVRQRFGIAPLNVEMQAHHQAYIQRFFHALNHGARKHVLPRGLRWLKAPGGQVYYWGALPPFRGQEKVTDVTLHYREEYFDGRDLKCVRDEQVLAVSVPDETPPAPVCELTPKDVDDYLLGLARGRLIDLPGFGDGYIRGDDGMRRGRAQT